MQTYRDIIYQEVKLYIDGVQIPFINIAVNQQMGGLPSASIAIPPMAGMMDIARFYQPKVHIFFTERSLDLSGNAVLSEKVLFTGIITTSHYVKTKNGNGNKNITFDCIHRYNLITECIADYSGFIRETDIGSTPDQMYTDMSNSKAAIQAALNGWATVATPQQDYTSLTPLGPGNQASNLLPSYLSSVQNRLKGMVGVFINYWNQLNRAAFNPNLSSVQGTFINIYKPLIEEGLQFFTRMTGHMVIEKAVDSSKLTGCGKTGNEVMLIPPCHKLFFESAVQANLTVNSLNSFLQNSNEVTNIYEIFQNYYNTLEYDILTLACPAEVTTDPDKKGAAPTYAVDTIIKPSLPFYYSPICNVLFPTMYTSISVSYDEVSMPTRVDVLNMEVPNANNLGVHYRTPASVREAIADKGGKGANLQGTINTSRGAIGKYEMGRGIKYSSISMPSWMTNLAASEQQQAGANTSSTPPSGSYNAMASAQLEKAWNDRYPGRVSLNPYSSQNVSGIQPYQQLIFSTADYYYTKKFAGTKMGMVEGLFNPYIIPGYPMDILEADPDSPSFHALCVGVSHNISASSIGTQINFAAAMTYAELINYYIPFMNPYLQVTLGLAGNPSLVNTDTTGVALSIANDFYHPTIGVNAVTPNDLFEFSTGMTKSVKISQGNITSSGLSLSDHTTEDDLLICRRPIESKADFASRTGITYIDMLASNYTATGVKYEDPTNTKISEKYEIGQSQFLDYSDSVYKIINSIT